MIIKSIKTDKDIQLATTTSRGSFKQNRVKATTTLNNLMLPSANCSQQNFRKGSNDDANGINNNHMITSQEIVRKLSNGFDR